MTKSIHIKTCAAAVFAGTLLSPGIAFSADVAPAREWTGFYLGAGGGGNYTFSNLGASGYGIMGVGGACLPGDKIPNRDVKDGDLGDCAHLFSQDGEYFADYYSNRQSITEYFGGSAAIIGSGSGSVMSEIEQAITDAGMQGAISKEIQGILDNVAGSLNGEDINDGAASFFGRGQVGFDYQLNDRIVVGLDAAYNLGEASIDQNATAAAGGFVDASDDGNSVGGSHLDANLTVNNLWTVGGRMGFLATESTLLFVSGGYASAKGELSAAYESEPTTEVSADIGSSYWSLQSSNSEWLSGYYVGGGMETMLTSSLSLRAEYRFTDLGSIETSASAADGYSPTRDVDPSTGFAAAGVSAEAEPVVHSISASINWRF